VANSDPKQEMNPAPKKRPLKERLWKLFAILFYITVAVGAIYHLFNPI